METLMKFEYQQQEVRTVVKEDGEQLWVAKDVCEVLGISKYRDAIARLDDDQKGTCPVRLDRNVGDREMAVVNESGLYELIIRSDKPEARAFRKWVTSEVLPALRKTGKYEVPDDLARRLQQMALVMYEKDQEIRGLKEVIVEKNQELAQRDLDLKQKQNMLGGQQQMVDILCRALGDSDGLNPQQQRERKQQWHDAVQDVPREERKSIDRLYRQGCDVSEICERTGSDRGKVLSVMYEVDEQQLCQARINQRQRRLKKMRKY